MSIILENATCDNTCEYSLTGQICRVKLLWQMGCNSAYAIFAVEYQDKIYKAYVWKGGINKRIGDIFYVKFGKQSDDIYGCYWYELCDKNGIIANNDYEEEYFLPDYCNKYEPKNDVYNSDIDDS